MYVPKKLAMSEAQCLDFIKQYPFAQLISENPLQCTHLPMVLHQSRESSEKHFVHCHMAKANPHHRDLNGKKVLVTFSGPHAYISGSWYESKPAVPTWNYASVHVTASATVLPSSDNAAISHEILAQYEPNHRAQEDVYDDAYIAKLNAAIVSVRLDIEKMEGVLKLGQHRSQADQQSVTNALDNSNHAEAQQLTEFMRKWKLGTGEV